MASETFNLAILISLRDFASRDADRIGDKLRAMGKEGQQTLKTFQDLRADLKRGLALGAVGIAGLAAMRGGVKVAGDFEAALADLRLSIQEIGPDGRINLAKLNDEMNRFEHLGVRLGNALPGTTRDFIEMFSTLKQGGVPAKTIIEGVGEAVANLAVVTGQVPRDLAEPFAQYVQQFDLRGKEAVKLSDLLARLSFRAGLVPQQLIEGSKFFQLRVGEQLGLSGFQGAETSGRILAALRRRGLEGGIGGRELAAMFREMFEFDRKEKRNVLSELRRKGIDLQFFDRKGQFAGIENAFAQMEKLRKLAPLEQGRILGRLFTSESMAPANIMIKTGVEGWREANTEIDKGARLQDLINEKTSTFNAKLESTLGTMENLVATTFTPLSNTLKPVLDTANQIAGALQQWSKEHQTLTGIAVHLFGVGSAALVVVGGFRAMRTAWRLWKIASAVGAGDRALPEFFRRTGDEAHRAGGKVGGLRGQLGRIPPTIKTTITLVGIEYAISRLIDVKDAYDKYIEALEGQNKSATQAFEVLQKMKAESERQGKPIPEQLIKTEAASALESLNINRQLELGLAPERFRYGGLSFPWDRPFGSLVNPFRSRFFDVETAAGEFRARAPQLAEPLVMREFISALERGVLSLSPEKIERLRQALEVGFPESFRQAENAIHGLTSPTRDASTEVGKLADESSRASASLDDFATQLTNFHALRQIGIEPYGQIIDVPSRATGGYVEREGIVNVHPGEQIVPARVTRGLDDERAFSARSGDVHVTVNINIPPGSPALENPRELARFVTKMVANEVRRQKARR